MAYFSLACELIIFFLMFLMSYKKKNDTQQAVDGEKYLLPGLSFKKFVSPNADF